MLAVSARAPYNLLEEGAKARMSTEKEFDIVSKTEFVVVDMVTIELAVAT
jgi:hypothetical protein